MNYNYVRLNTVCLYQAYFMHKKHHTTYMQGGVQACTICACAHKQNNFWDGAILTEEKILRLQILLKVKDIFIAFRYEICCTSMISH